MGLSAPAFMAIEESGVATVCVTLLDSIERDLSVTLSTIEQSEYATLHTSLTFTIHFVFFCSK